MTLKERMEKALQHARTTQAALASACGVKPPSVSDWLSGKTKSLRGSTAVLAAKHLGVRVDWLVANKGPMLEGSGTHKSHSQPDDDGPVDYDLGRNYDGRRGHPDLVVKVPVIQTTGRDPQMQAHSFEDIEVPRPWLNQWEIEPNAAVFVAVTDDAMAPEIRAGGQCLADTSQTEVLPGERYVIEIGGRIVVRRLHLKLDGTLRISADAGSPQWPEETVAPQDFDKVRVIARIKWIFNRA